MRSMTGFGSGRSSDGTREYFAEIRSVNHRFCDVRVRVPSEAAGLEARVEGAIRRRIERGRVEASVTISNVDATAGVPEVDVARARTYRDRLMALAEALNLDPKLSLEALATLPGVIRSPEARLDLSESGEQVDLVVEAALDQLVAMREEEGRALERDLRHRLGIIETRVHDIRCLLPEAQVERRRRLEERLTELLSGRPLDTARLAQEVAILVDRSDVTEELTRLASHVHQLGTIFEAREQVGRRVDFLIQELNREANTIGSKTTHAAISHVVVELKAEIERMREQAQNVE